MKKLIALTLCMLLLLSGCAYLGGASGAMVQLRDMYITDPDTTIDLRGLSAGVEIGNRGDSLGLRLTVSAEDQLKNELVLAVAEESVLFLLSGSTGEPYAYVVDDPQVVAPIRSALEQAMAADIPADGEDVDLENMTDEELAQYMAELEEQLKSMGLGDESDPEAADEAAAQAERMAEILEQCVSEGEPKQFEGEMYDTTNIDLPHDELMELLGMIDASEYVEQDTDLAGLLEEAGVTVDLTGVIAVNADGTKSAYGFTPVFTNAEGKTITLNFTLQSMAEDGSLDLYFDAAEDGQDLGSLALNIAVSLLDEVTWLPDGLPDDAQRVDLDDEASRDAFTDALADFLGQVSGTLAGVVLGNGAIGALD